MCNPMAAAAALQIVQGATQYSAAKQSSKYIQGQLVEQSQLQAQATNDQLEQINSQAATDMSARAIAAARERAQLRVAAGEAGVGGNSPAISEMRSQFAEGYDMTTINSNRIAALKQATLEGRSAQARTQAEFYQNAPPNPLSSVLTIGANVAGLYSRQPSAPKV